MKHETMERLNSIVYALSHNLDPSIFKDNYEYDSIQMIHVFKAMEDGLDISSLLNPSIQSIDMYNVRRALKFGVDLEIVLNNTDESVDPNHIIDVVQYKYYLTKIKEADHNIDLSVFENIDIDNDLDRFRLDIVTGIGEQLDKGVNIVHYLSEGFDLYQLRKIVCAYGYTTLSNDRIEKYAKPEFNANQMDIIFLYSTDGGLTPEQVDEFAKPEFDDRTMFAIANAMAYGVYNDAFKEYLDKYLKADKDIPGDRYDD